MHAFWILQKYPHRFILLSFPQKLNESMDSLMCLIQLKELLASTLEGILFAKALNLRQIVLIDFSQFVILQLLIPLLHVQRFYFKIQSIYFPTQRFHLGWIRLDIYIFLLCCFHFAYIAFQFALEFSLKANAFLMMYIFQSFDLVQKILVFAFELLQLFE